MPVIVQKFGGTSVADAPRIHLAARRAVRALLDGNQVVMVVSAMGHTTDQLVQLACQVSRRPSKRELDMLLATGEQISIALVAMAIQEAGYEAISLTGAQVGLLTDSAHTAARIQCIDTARIRRLLDQGKIVIVAGFQGVDRDFDITTLGRGGSDTTAVALAAALRAKTCEVYTDVDGVYTADPRLVPTARKLEQISCDEMLELAGRGAQVMHARAIELGKKFGVAIHVRSSLSDSPGTIIMDQLPSMEEVVVRGAALERGIARVTLFGLSQEPGLAAAVFDEIAGRAISVDDIAQTVSADGSRVTLSFTVQGREEGEVRAVAELLAQRFAAEHLDVCPDLVRVSIVGAGLRTHPGVAARMFGALAAEKIRVASIATSEIVISVLVPAADGERALQAVHQVFGLGQ
jgi:aspartate kinase